MLDKITQGLERAFNQHRIVFWQDPDETFVETFADLSIEGVEKVQVNGNAFGLKYRMLRQEPRQQFLVYRPGPPPADLDNWLLDLELAYGVFRADQTALILGDLGLPSRYDALVKEHAEFFAAKTRQERLRALLGAEDTADAVRLKMLAVCAGCQGGLNEVMEVLLQELADATDAAQRLIQRSDLETFLWARAEAMYGYSVDSPSLEDFAIQLFRASYRAGLGQAPELSSEALLLFARWKNSRTAAAAFQRLSARYAEVLDIEADLPRHDVRALIEMDQFELIDRHLISALVQALARNTLSLEEVEHWLRARRTTHWYPAYADLYEAIGHAAGFQKALSEARLELSSLAEGVERYTRAWFSIDQRYRKFWFHAERSGQSGLLAAISSQIENHYSNRYLLPLTNAWQDVIDRQADWEAEEIPRQRCFYATQVLPFRRRDQKVVVIISDALRYEIGEELLRKVRALDRYQAELSALFGVLPSYTQLGMAALLPNCDLRIAEAPGASGTAAAAVSVDGLSATGTENRARILARGRPEDRTTARQIREVMGLDREALRALIRDHDVLYLYHNRVDAVGDKRDTEQRVFEAAEDALEDLIKLIKKLTGNNVSNLLITADHGFLYQHHPLEESDYSGAEVEGEDIRYRDRRFVLGSGLRETPGLRHFSAQAVGLEGTTELLIPKSINRLRLSGSGSRFVHGGASLQEVVVPVLHVHKTRTSDTETVEVNILTGATRMITTNQHSVVLYQAQPASEKCRALQLRAGLYAADGALISDQHDLLFDLVSENPRDRERPVRFLLSRAADAYDGQEVELRLETRFGKTSTYQTYKSASYRLRRAFGGDFDF
ncbi:MAG: BREX-1 system phosphatase PglZ type A [Chromatiaceae bacterium]|nr:BREX-1 system phosphatase PglZ type A [Chromatiaceae bacterium]